MVRLGSRSAPDADVWHPKTVMNNDTTSRVTHACFTSAEFALDDLITRNRDMARLRMANNEDILALHAFLTPGEVVGKLLDWHLVCLDFLGRFR